MASVVATPPFTNHLPVLTEEQIQSIAHTYSASAQPVWVHDLWMRCVYCNDRAREAYSADTDTQVTDIIDHAGRVVGHLTIGSD